jgi:hypothetical protein
LVKQFRRLRNPASDPDRALRSRLLAFFAEYFESKGSEGGNRRRGFTALAPGAGAHKSLITIRTTWVVDNIG